MTRTVAVRNASRGRVLASRAEVASGPLRRALGLIGRTGWSAADGLVLEPCSGVHTFFMRMPVDVVHVAADGTVLRTIEGMRPWRIGPLVRRARWVLELPVGVLEESGTRIGDRVERGAPDAP